MFIRFVGRFEFMDELVVIRDLELIKKITVKDFEHFLDHRAVFTTDSFFSRNLLSLTGMNLRFKISIYVSLVSAITQHAMLCTVFNPICIHITKHVMHSNRSRMERHALHIESCVYKFQDASDGALHGGGGRPDDEYASEKDQGIQM